MCVCVCVWTCEVAPMRNEAQRHEIVWEVEAQFHAFLTSALFLSSCFSQSNVAVMSTSFQSLTFLHSPSCPVFTKFLAYPRVRSRVKPAVLIFTSEDIIKAVNRLRSSNFKQTNTSKYSKYKTQTHKQTNKETRSRRTSVSNCVLSVWLVDKMGALTLRAANLRKKTGDMFIIAKEYLKFCLC